MPLRFVAAAALAAIAACCGFSLLASGDRGSYDLQAFYCAGEALRAHADPYRAQPLGACEHRQTDGTYAALAPGVVLPAPQPGYDIAAFAPLSLLPFGMARAVWGALLGIAVFVAVYCTLQITGAPLRMVAMAFAASLILPSFAFGELFAFFAAAACAAMLFASQHRWSAAALAAAASLVEPHLGLPLCASLFIWKPQVRRPMLLAVSVLAAIAFAALGARENVEYAGTILRLHALSEITSDAQLGLSAVLYGAGFADSVALRLGAISYVVCAVGGVYYAGALARRFEDDAFLGAVPAAFAVIGGAFMHVTEMFAAVPLVLLLLMRASERRAMLLVAAVLLCVPWIAGIERGNAAAFAMLGALVAGILLWEREAARVVVALTVAALTCGVLMIAPEWYAHAASLYHARAATLAIDPVYAQASWQAWNRQALSSGSLAAWMLRIPTWIGLALLASASIALGPHRHISNAPS